MLNLYICGEILRRALYRGRHWRGPGIGRKRIWQRNSRTTRRITARTTKS